MLMAENGKLFPMSDGDKVLSLLIAARRIGASDLLLVAGAPPSVYVNSRMERLADEALGAHELNDMVAAFLNTKQRERLDQYRDLDFSFGTPNKNLQMK